MCPSALSVFSGQVYEEGGLWQNNGEDFCIYWGGVWPGPAPEPPWGLTCLRFNKTKGPGPNFFPAKRCLLSRTLLTFPWDWHSRLLYVPVLWEGD